MSTAPFPLDWLSAEAQRLGLDLDGTAIARFETYLAMLLEWRDRAGLTALTDPAAIEQRHFGESLSLLAALRRAGILTPGQPVRLADIGTGAGFPGLPMRIADPSIQLTLIESHARRCHFLEVVVSALEVSDVTVVQARAEEAGRDPALRATFDVVVARALAALPILVEYSVPLLRLQGVLAAPKGSRGDLEQDEAATAIELLGGTAEPALQMPLPTGVPPQRVLLVRRTRALDDRFPRRTGIPAKRPLR